MAYCVIENATTGALEIASSTLESCSSFALYTVDEALVISQSITDASSITLADIFAIPEASALGLAFQTSFNLVLICWLSAWAYGVVVNYFSPQHER
jgi:alanine racemase